VDAPALSVTGLVKRFRDPEGATRTVVSVASLSVERGGSLALVGESGSGKTTFLHLVSGVLEADEGVVEVGGERMTGRSEAARDRLRARHIGYVFQTFNLLPGMTALENVALGMTFRPREGEAPRTAARAALERVGLSGHLHHLPHRLSAGQQQRVAIARALAGQPTLVLADEPTSALDRKNAEACVALLREFASERGAALLVATHDPAVIAAFPRTATIAAPVEADA
jgi:putative ABC transport system ATP-binding protein